METASGPNKRRRLQPKFIWQAQDKIYSDCVEGYTALTDWSS